MIKKRGSLIFPELFWLIIAITFIAFVIIFFFVGDDGGLQGRGIGIAENIKNLFRFG